MMTVKLISTTCLCIIIQIHNSVKRNIILAFFLDLPTLLLTRNKRFSARASVLHINYNFCYCPLFDNPYKKLFWHNFFNGIQMQMYRHFNWQSTTNCGGNLTKPACMTFSNGQGLGSQPEVKIAMSVSSTWDKNQPP